MSVELMIQVGVMIGRVEALEKENESLRAQLVSLRNHALAAMVESAESGTTECGCCGANWLEHGPLECVIITTVEASSCGDDDD